MLGRTQGVIAIGVACVLMVILISPTAPSPPTTAPTKHTLSPPNVVIHLAGLLWAAAAPVPECLHEFVPARPSHPTASDSDLVDVTTVRLC
jgi:hypothetical protein